MSCKRVVILGFFPYIATFLVQIYEEMKYLILFLTFAKIGMFTIGGGYAMIPLIEREIVNKKWMTKNDFMEMFASTGSICCKHIHFCRLQTA